MIPTPSTHSRLSAVSPSGNISHRLSTLPATARPEILPCESRFTRLEFRDATGLSCLAVDKFLELGFIKPFGVWENGRREIYYSMRDLKKVRVMMTLLDGKLNLVQAHEKAQEILNGTTPYRNRRVKKALQLSPPERFIDRPYEMPSDWKQPEDSDADTEQETHQPQKSRRVNLTVTHSDTGHSLLKAKSSNMRPSDRSQPTDPPGSSASWCRDFTERSQTIRRWI